MHTAILDLLWDSPDIGDLPYGGKIKWPATSISFLYIYVSVCSCLANILTAAFQLITNANGMFMCLGPSIELHSFY